METRCSIGWHWSARTPRSSDAIFIDMRLLGGPWMTLIRSSGEGSATHALDVLPGLQVGLFTMNRFRAQHVIVLGHGPRPTDQPTGLRVPEVAIWETIAAPGNFGKNMAANAAKDGVRQGGVFLLAPCACCPVLPCCP